MTRQWSGRDLGRLRRMNAQATLGALRAASEPLTLTELAQLTNLSRASVEELVAQLAGRGWVAEVPPLPGSVGRPARRYHFQPNVGYVVGMDIGAYKVLATIADLNDRVLGTARVPVSAETPRAERLGAADSALTAALAEAGVGPAEVWAIGVGTTGVVSASGEVVLSEAAAQWQGVRVADHLRTYCPSERILVDNDTRLAALAEHRDGAGQGVEDVIYLHAGLHTSAAAVINNRLHRGYSGAAAEMWAFPITAWERGTCPLSLSPIVPADVPVEDAAAYVLAAARRDDAQASVALDEYVANLAMGAAAMTVTLDPEVIVLGGGLALSADVLLPRLRAALEPLCLRTPELRTSCLGLNAVATGGVRLALDHLEAVLFDPEHELGPTEAPRSPHT